MQTSFVVAFADGIDQDCLEKMKEHPRFQVVLGKAKLSPGELEQNLNVIEALVVRSATKVDESLLSRAPKLRYVIRAGEGVDNIDLVKCKERGVKVSNTPGANNNSAAEHAVALMFSLLRKIPTAHQSMVNGKWEKSAFVGNELTGKRVGLVGMGRIGQLVAKRISGFDPKILFYDPYVKESLSPQVKKVDSLTELFQQVDIVSLHLPLIPATKNLINFDTLKHLSPHAIFINASRGGIVVEEDLCQMLKEGKIAGAALDVFSQEPLPTTSPWLNCPNVILTPHLGASTKEAEKRVGPMVFEQLLSFFLSERAINLVEAK